MRAVGILGGRQRQGTDSYKATLRTLCRFDRLAWAGPWEEEFVGLGPERRKPGDGYADKVIGSRVQAGTTAVLQPDATGSICRIGYCKHTAVYGSRR